MKQGKNHVSWNENPPDTASIKDSLEKEDETDSDEIGSPPRITKTTKVVTNSAEYEEMKKRLDVLKEEERDVDRYLDYLKQQAAVFNGSQPPTAENAPYLPPGFGNISDEMFVRFEDVTAMPSYSSDTVIGIRAPSGTSLEVPDPDQGMRAGERRFEMYLSSKGAEGEGSSVKGEPINVYLVRPRADQQGKRGGRGDNEGFVQETPPSQREPPHRDEPEDKDPEEPPEEDPTQQTPRAFAPPHPPPNDPQYEMGKPPHEREREWDSGPNRPPYYGSRPYRKDHAPPPGHPGPSGPPGPPGHPGPPGYPDSAWGPPRFGGYGPPPGYYPPPGHRPMPQGGSRPPTDPHKRPSREDHREADTDERVSGSDSEHPRDDGMYASSGAFAPPREGLRQRGPVGPRDTRTVSPFRPRSHHFQPPPQHGHGRSGPGAGEGPPPRDGGSSYPPPPSPVSQQQTLLNMPLQSPNGSFGMPSSYYPSPSGAQGYNSPSVGGPRENIRSGDVAFPMPPLRDGRDDYRGSAARWHQPRQHHMDSPPSSRPEDPPRSHPPPRSRR
jgi:hypothetical protein